MSGEEFFNLVDLLREKQKRYFRTKLTDDLRESIKVEKVLDAEIARVKQILKNKQEPKLF